MRVGIQDKNYVQYVEDLILIFLSIYFRFYDEGDGVGQTNDIHDHGCSREDSTDFWPRKIVYRCNFDHGSSVANHVIHSKGDSTSFGTGRRGKHD
jgi:hypothetical protein